MDRTDDQEKRFLAEWVEAGLGVLKAWRAQGQFLTMKEGGGVAERVFARTALRITNDDVGKALKLLGTTRRSFNRALNDKSVPCPGDLWHDFGMSGPFDDALFPFCRVMWPKSADAAFVDELFAWWTTDIAPRAATEDIRFIALENFSAFSGGLPPMAVVNAMMAHKDEYLTQVAPRQLGTIIFSPRVPLADFFFPIINIAPFDIKVATTPSKAIALARAKFEKAGIQTPDLEIN